uniref:Glycosyltransferase family 2 protein n=1 Tax=Caldimicrobium thiodismutans TaxID=1653476 RepID=A0A832GP41_9BACT
MEVNVSIVLYNTRRDFAERAIRSVLSSPLVKSLYVIDNSPSPNFPEVREYDARVEYILTGCNLGYGRAHNLALERSIKEGVTYHLVMNPDVYFDEDVIGACVDFMEKNLEVGLLIPKVFYPDGRVQPVARLLPSPFHLIFRRFLNFGIFKRFVEKMNKIYEMEFTGYSRTFEAPFISGCFMFLRVAILKYAGVFDKRFFLYCDDLDLSRRIHRCAKTIFYPGAKIYHHWTRNSYRSFKFLLYHIWDAIKYFNKWGWFWDKERKLINRKILEQFERSQEIMVS